MIKEWAGDDAALGDIYSYLKKVPNVERIRRLCEAFVGAGIDVNRINSAGDVCTCTRSS